MLYFITSNPIFGVIFFIAFVLSLSVHEFSHAAVAVALGDETPRRAGRLTLNPMAHLDLIGTLMVLVVGFGWARPVPFNPYNLRIQRWGPTLVALAGPFSNLVLIIIFGLANLLLIDKLGPSNLLTLFMASMVLVSAIIFIFNLLPIPPLDGSKFLLDALASPKHQQLRFWLETRGPLIILGIFLLDFVFNVGIFSRIIGLGISLLMASFQIPFFG